MMDVGKKIDYLHDNAPSTRPKVSYPTLTVGKDLGDYKVGQTVKLEGEGVVTGLSRDRYGYELRIEVRKLACHKGAEASKVGQRLAGYHLGKDA